MKISDCCGVPPIGNSDDYGICPECKEHCDYVNDNADDRTGMTNYKGFQLNHSFIYKDGKEVFIRSWRQDRTEADSMRLIDNQVDFVPPVVAAIALRQHEDCCELENGSEDRERFEEKMNDYFENQMYE